MPFLGLSLLKRRARPAFTRSECGRGRQVDPAGEGLGWHCSWGPVAPRQAAHNSGHCLCRAGGEGAVGRGPNPRASAAHPGVTPAPSLPPWWSLAVPARPLL